MSKINDGGPAFPLVINPGFEWADNGLTKREYFAGLAMQASISGYLASGKVFGDEEDSQLIAKVSTVFADELIKSLAATTPE